MNTWYFIPFVFLLVTICESLCPKNGVGGSMEGSCYFGINFNSTFDDANEFCSTYFYGNLASITSPLDDNTVLYLAKSLFKDTKNVWLGAIYNQSKVQWIDGSPDIYRNFMNGTEPGRVMLDLVTGKWTTASWNGIIPYVCLKKENLNTIAPTVVQTSSAPPINRTTTTPPPSCPMEPPCPSEWVYAQDLKTCYKTLFNLNQPKAQDACVSMGANLASIHSDEENRIVNQILKSGSGIGGIFSGGLIGGKRTGRGASEWMWIDGTPWNYTKWAVYEPNFYGGDEFCLEVYQDRPNWTRNPNGDEQKWNDLPCQNVVRGTICKKAAKY